MVTVKQKKKVTGSDILRSGFDLGSSTQNDTSCWPRSRDNSELMSIRNKVIQDRGISELDKAVIMLLLEHGLRISEVLRLELNDFIGSSKILVHSLKNSQNRIITNAYGHLVLKKHVEQWGCIGFIFSRFYYYRLLSKIGCSFQFGSNSKHSVTHAGRHLVSLELSQGNVNLSDLQAFLGHKSIKSTERYIRRQL